jgi:hypothetical protein
MPLSEVEAQLRHLSTTVRKPRRWPGRLLTIALLALVLVSLLAGAPPYAAAAAVTHRISTASTLNVTTYASGAFTPTVGSLLVAVVTATGTRDDSGAGLAKLSNSLGVVFVKVERAHKAASVDTSYLFVACSFAAASSQTVTFDCTGDASTGVIIQAFELTGMTRTGIDAVRQTAKQENQAAAGTPGPAFAAAALTGNPTMGLVSNATSPATMTPNASWTERDDVGFATPTTGAEYMTRDSGFTSTTIAWGGTSASAFCSLIVEFDASAATSSCPYALSVGAVAHGTASLTVVPPTTAANDIALLVVNQSDTGALTGMAGYTQKWQQAQGTTCRQTGLWKRAAGVEGNVTVTYSGGGTISAYIVVWRGCITSGDPFDGTPVSQGGAATTTVTGPTYTPTNTPVGVGFAASASAANTSGAASMQVWSGTFPTFQELVQNYGTDGARSATCGHAWGGTRATTALGARTVTDTGEGATPDTVGTIYALKGQPVGGGVVEALTGSIDGVSTFAATGVRTRQISGPVPGISTLTATARRTRQVSGTVAGTSALNATGRFIRALVGAVAGTSALNATGRRTRQISGPVVGTSALSAIGRRARGLTSTLPGTSSLGGALRRTRPLAGSVPGTSSFVATLSMAGVTALAGAIVATAQLVAGLSRQRRFSGSIDSSGIVSGRLNATLRLQAAVVGLSHLVADATIKGAVKLAGAIAASSQLTGYASGKTGVHHPYHDWSPHPHPRGAQASDENGSRRR